MLYLIIIAAANILIALSGWLWLDYPVFDAILKPVSATVAVIAVDGIFAFLVRRLPLPEKWFSPGSKLSRVSKAERKFYRKTRVNNWAKKIPELGCFTGFRKDKLQTPTDKEYLKRFITEANYGVAIHLSNALFGALILLVPYVNSLASALPVIAVNFILSMLPVFTLRHNLPPLISLYQRTKK